MRRTLVLITLLFASGGLVQAKECRDIKNNQARENCYKHSKENNASQHCSELKNSNLRRECLERQYGNDKNCSDLNNENLRRECREHKADKNKDCSDLKNDTLRRECREKKYDNKPQSSSRSSAEAVCGAAHSKSDYDKCMIDKGFRP